MLIFHFDSNFVQRTIPAAKAILKEVSALGYNAVLWELEDQVRWETCPECAQADSWSKEEFEELLAYSRGLGLEPIPLLQTVGHGEYVMKHPAYRHFREDAGHSDCYCTSNPEVRAFLKRWLEEFVELFGSVKYFHMGGDEAWWFGSCPECSRRKRGELYAEHIFDLAEVLLKHGIRPGVWGDMILKENMLDVVPKSFVLWDWQYHVGAEGVFPTTDKLLAAGFDVFLCSSAKSVADSPFLPNAALHIPNLYGVNLKASSEPRVIGHCVTSWSIRQNLIDLAKPILEIPCLMAQKPGIPYPEVRTALGKKYFGFENAFEALEKLSAFDSGLRRYTGVQWDDLKDSVTPPAEMLKDRIAQWTKDQAPIWIKFTELLDELDAAHQEGLAMLRPYAKDFPMAAKWLKAGELQETFFALLRKAVLTPNAALVPFLEAHRQEVVDYLGAEETPASARKNAELLLKPLRDYCQNA